MKVNYSINNVRPNRDYKPLGRVILDHVFV